jgi:hypothetical protein
MSESKFRLLIILYVLATLAAIGAGFAPTGYSQVLADVYEQELDAWFSRNVWLLVAVAVPLLVATVTGVIGLFMLKRWGRTISLYSTIVGLCVCLFAIPELSSAFESVLFEASSLLWGAILAIAYYSPIADRLGANHSFKPNPLRRSA